MASVTVLVCDHCGTMEDVLNYDIAWDGGQKAHLDLCTEGRKPLEKLLELEKQQTPAPAATPAPRKRASRRTAGRTGLTRVTTMDEIEKAKK